MFREIFEFYTGEAYETGSEFSAKEANLWVKKLTKDGYTVEKIKYVPKFYALLFKSIVDIDELEEHLNSKNFTQKLFMV